MKPRLLVVLAVGLLLAADGPKEDVKKEQEKFQGEWTMVSGKRDGMEAPEDFVKALKRNVKGEEYTVTRDGETVVKGKFKIDPAKKPKTIDFTIKDASDQEMILLGIYEMDGDQFKVCYATPGKDRPKEFAAEAGSGHSLGVWKRAKK